MGRYNSEAERGRKERDKTKTWRGQRNRRLSGTRRNEEAIKGVSDQYRTDIGNDNFILSRSPVAIK